MAPRLSTMSSVELTVGCRAVFEALDPTSLAPVAGVKITDPTIYGVNVTPNPDDVQPLIPPSPVTGAYTTGGGMV